MKSLLCGSLFLITFLAAIPARAHHSMAGFDRDKTVTLNGTVKQFKWANPHAWIEMEVPDGKGGAVTWNVEMTSPAVLIRAGWKSSVLKPGDTVTLMAHPQKNGEPGGSFVSVTTAEGNTLTDKPVARADAPSSAK